MQLDLRQKKFIIYLKNIAKKIRYADLKNIIKLIYGLIIEQKIIIDGLSSGKEIEKLINKECNKKKGIYNISDIRKPLVVPSVKYEYRRCYMF